VAQWTFEIYEVPNSYLSGGGSPTITDVLSIRIQDGDSDLDANEGDDPGGSQRIFVDGVQVDSYEFYYDDTITINGATETVKTFQLTIDGTVRTFIMSDDNHNLPGVNTGDSFDLEVYVDYTVVPYTNFACFARNTRIETDAGKVNVEDLKVGDRIKTKDNGFQRIRWIGRSQLTVRDLLRLPHLRPVKIAPHTFGHGLPERELRLSPQHRVLMTGWSVQLNFGLDEILAPAKSIVGKIGVSVDLDCREVEYFHMMFDQHEVVFSEGLPTESFLVGDTIRNGMDQSQLNEILELFPELADLEAGLTVLPARPILRNFEVQALECLAA
jgi:hypothetical protein